MTDRAIAVETTIDAPFDAVWEALRDPVAIRRWHGWEYDGLADEIDEIYFQSTRADAAAGMLEMADGSGFELERDGERTVVRVMMQAADWERTYDDIREGWTSFVLQLRFALERHPGEDRRTLQLSGAPAELGVALDGAPGERYEAETAWGERWSGEVLFRNEHQVVLTVDGYGPGLVIVHTKPDGDGMAIVTTYGLDDDAFAALQRRWSAWGR
jgi:hypothetical protein